MTVEGSADIDVDATVGTVFPISATSTVTIIDPFKEYVDVLKSSFDFDAIREFSKHPEFSILYDGMHGPQLVRMYHNSCCRRSLMKLDQNL